MKRIIIVIFLGSLLMSCAHRVEFRSPDLYPYSMKLPMKAIFYMEPDLREKVWSGRAFSSGIAHRWDVPIGKVVEQYAEAYLKDGFDSFIKIDDLGKKPSYDIIIRVTDIHYRMASQAAHCEIELNVEDSKGVKLLNRRYKEDGPSGMGMVAVGGVFAQKSAIRQSTHVVLSNIFKNILADLRVNYRDWNK